MERSKIKKGKSKTAYSYLFHLNFVKMKRKKSILAVYKYLRKLLTKALSPKILSNILSLLLFSDWLLPLKF